MKRILDCHASDFAAMSGRELLAAIAGSEGRTIACETIGALMPMLGDITNAEFAAAMGADILLLNLFDVQHPVIRALPEYGTHIQAVVLCATLVYELVGPLITKAALTKAGEITKG